MEADEDLGLTNILSVNSRKITSPQPPVLSVHTNLKDIEHIQLAVVCSAVVAFEVALSVDAAFLKLLHDLLIIECGNGKIVFGNASATQHTLKTISI